MAPNTAREIRRFSRRVRAALFCGGFATSLATLALGLAVALLLLRPLGFWAAPESWWLVGLLLPVGYGFWRARRLGFSSGISAAHLDRRLGLEGLLIAAQERDPGEWGESLEVGLARARASLPRPRWRQLGAWPAGSVAVLAFVLSLDAPVMPTFVSNPPMEQQLAELNQDLELMLEEGVVDEERGEDLATRLQELQERIEEGEAVEWSDVDSLDELLAHELAEQNARLEKALAQLSAFAAGEAESATPSEAAEAFAEMLENASMAGLPLELTPELAEQLGQPLGPGGQVDPGSLPTSPEDLQRLAQALAEAAGEQLGDLALQGLVDPAALTDLQDVLAQYDLMGVVGHVHGPECVGGNCPAGMLPGAGQFPGRGGISRGPGAAMLNYSNQTEGDTSAFEARRLPPGRSASQEWQLVGLSRARPDADPERATGAGGEGEAGTGAASWRRRLAPRHREVVRKFFTDRDED